MTVERTALGVTGAAFLLRAMASGLPSYARIGYALVGWNLVSGAWSAEGTRAANPIGRSLGDGSSAGPSPVKLTMEPRKVRTLGERVARIHEQALKGTKDPTIYALVREVLTQRCGEDWCIAERDYQGEVTALFNEVRKRVRYTADPLVYDAFQTPQKTLELKAGDCDDETSLLGAMLIVAGYPVASRVVWTKGNATWNHIYLRVRMPKPVRLTDENGREYTTEWMPLDPTVNKPAGWEVPQSMLIQSPRDFPMVAGT